MEPPRGVNKRNLPDWAGGRRIGPVGKRIRIISNPVSGRGGAKRLSEAVARILRERGCEVDLAETRQGGDARRMAAGVAGWDAVGVAGGDGTLHEVVNGLDLEGAPPLAVIPSGTANVLAKEIGLRRQTGAIADVLASGREIPWTLGVDRVEGRRFLLFASAGYDATVVHLFHKKRRGPIRMSEYLWWGIKSLLDHEPPRLVVELDGQELTRQAAWVLVSNVSAYGGPLVFTPRGDPGRGTFEVMVLHGRDRRDTVRMFGRAFAGWLTGMDLASGGVTFHRASRVAVRAGEGSRVPVQADGDPAGFLPMDLEARPGALRVLAP
jgi:diacylglycerol kinase (ATP)